METTPFLIQYHLIKQSSYRDAWEFQTLLHNSIKSRKSSKSGQDHDKINTFPVNHLVFCEHLPVITMGKSGKELNLTTPEDKLPEHGIEYFRINRGGDVTYHGPGQITGYLIFDLELLYRDVHRFVREIEEVIIIFLAEYGLNAFRLDGYTGVWLGEEGNHRKICAIGVHLSRWVSMHGFALNINTNLDHFNHIVPCGIGEAGKSVTSLQQELGHSIDMDEAFAKLRDFTADVFKGKIVSSWN